MKESANNLKTVISVMRDPAFRLDGKGDISFVNDAVLKLLNKPANEIIGSTLENHFKSKGITGSIWNQLQTLGHLRKISCTLRAAPKAKMVLSGLAIKDDQEHLVVALVIVENSIAARTEQSELRDAMLKAELATKIAEEAQMIAEQAVMTAAESVKAKQQFLSNMSHEIRTPMNAIIGFTKVVMKTDLSAKQREYLTAIKLSGDSLIVLINDILDLAKVNAGKMAFEKTPFRLSASIATMLHLFEPKVEEKNIELIKIYDPKIPEVLLGDSVRLNQIILNLVSNAVKFTTTGKIIVSVRLLDETSDTVHIGFQIEDTGIGIEASKMDAVFENFQQASGLTSRLYGGTGLGLAIVKQLVEQQGGKVDLKSKVGEGSTFSFDLSFIKTNDMAQDINEIIAPIEYTTKVKVLVVEDIALNRLLMKTILDDFGFTNDMAVNGQVAIDKMQVNNYDVILMDLQMPVMSGYEATDFIRNTLKSDIPIIALTADVTSTDLKRCREVGMNDYIAKPVDEKILYTKILNLVKVNIELSTKNSEIEKIVERPRITNLSYLHQRTKSNPSLMAEMISLYLDQTPPLLEAIKTSYGKKDWKALNSAVHKMIPSFAIMGLDPELESKAKKIQEFARAHEVAEYVRDWVLQIETSCLQACEELKLDLIRIKKEKND